MALIVVTLAGLNMAALAQGYDAAPAKKLAANAPAGTKMLERSIQGTYKLVSRKLPDGKMLMPPDIEGLQTFTKDFRNFNIGWRTPEGKRFSYSVISQYTLNNKEYSETLLYSLKNDEIGLMPGAKGGAGPQYTMTSETKTAPVTDDNGHLKFKMPFDPPNIDITNGAFTATMPDGSVDTWEKVQ